MRNKSCSISNSSGAFRAVGGCLVRGWGFPIGLEHVSALHAGIRVFLSGYRGLSCFAEHSEYRMPDVFQFQSPLLISFQVTLHALKRSVEFLKCLTKVLKDLTK